MTRDTERPTLGEQLGIVRSHAVAATETEHDEIRRRIEVSGGAVFELPAGGTPAPKAAEVRASERIRLQRPGEPEFVIREGIVYTASGIYIKAADLPDWAKSSLAAAAANINVA